MNIFTEWKHDKEMIEDGVMAIVASLPAYEFRQNNPISISYMMLFEATCSEYTIESSTHLV